MMLRITVVVLFFICHGFCVCHQAWVVFAV